MTVDDIVRISHEAIRAAGLAVGEDVPAWRDSCEDIRRSAYIGVQKVFRNRKITPEQIHEEWMKDKFEHGWKCGRKKNFKTKTHPCLVPYEKLNDANKVKNAIFIEVVKQLEPFVVLKNRSST